MNSWMSSAVTTTEERDSWRRDPNLRSRKSMSSRLKTSIPCISFCRWKSEIEGSDKKACSAISFTWSVADRTWLVEEEDEVDEGVGLEARGRGLRMALTRGSSASSWWADCGSICSRDLFTPVTVSSTLISLSSSSPSSSSSSSSGA